MSLEERLSELTVALNANTAILKAAYETKGGGTAAATPTGTTETKKGPGRPPKDKTAVTAEALLKEIGDFLSEVPESEGREARKKAMRDVLGTFNGAKKTSEIPESERAAAMEKIKDKIKELKAAEAGGDDDAGSGDEDF